jgi:hypothetical protein
LSCEVCWVDTSGFASFTVCQHAAFVATGTERDRHPGYAVTDMASVKRCPGAA